MTFQTEELRRLIEYARDHWGIESHVLPHELARENLHESIRESVLEYFARHGIKWWISAAERGNRRSLTNATELPTGHLNSSQVACVNHLDPVRRNRALALALAKRIESDIVDVLPVENGGYAGYEWIGARNYLGERGARTRGANVTSLDALMLARRESGVNCLLVFEWKYLESYGSDSVAISPRGTDRVRTYAPLLAAPHCPIAVGRPEWLFYQPYYQLMRQTLLAWQMVEAWELGASEWIHVQVVPERNLALRGRAESCAPQLTGRTMADAWRSVLRGPDRYRAMTPTEIVGPEVSEGWQAWRQWLRDRYLT